MKTQPNSAETMARPASTRAERLRARRQPKAAPARGQVDFEGETPQPPDRIIKPAPGRDEEGNIFARPIRTQPHRNPKNGPQRSKWKQAPSVSKRFTIHLNKQGAELQVSSLPFTQFGWRGASGFLTIFSVVMLILFTQMKVDQIQFIGISDALAADIRNTLRVEGKPAFAIDPDTVQNTMKKAFPEISDARIAIAFPGIMKVQAKARTPLYAWLLGERVYLIDDQYMVYPAHAGESVEGLIVIHADQLPPPASILQQSGDVLEEIYDYIWADPDDNTPEELLMLNRSTYLVDGEVLSGLQNMLAFVPEGAQIHYSGIHGFGWQGEFGWDAWFGLDLSQMETKVGIYNAIVNYCIAEDINASLISVEYIRAPYYREE